MKRSIVSTGLSAGTSFTGPFLREGLLSTCAAAQVD